MSLPVERILWAPTNSAHYNHLHVVGDPRMAQSELPTSGIWTPAINVIVDALDARFGPGEHFIIDPDAAWTHMGVYNPRKIAGTDIWSQHAGANAIDLGPYYGVEEQQKFYDFLTGKEEDMPLTDQDIDKIVNRTAKAVWHRPVSDVPDVAHNKPAGRLLLETRFHAARDTEALDIDAVVAALEDVIVDPSNPVTADAIIDRLKERL